MSKKDNSTDLGALNKLSDALDVDFESEEILNKANEIQVRKNNIVDTLNKDEWTLDDKIYMEAEIKETICGVDDVMDMLKKDIKIGTQPRTHEVYATLAKIKIDALKELRELSRSVIDMKLVKAKATGSGSASNVQVNNYNMSSTDLLQMVKKAKNNNALNDVEAKFEIDEKDVALSSQNPSDVSLSSKNKNDEI
jgi:succinate dehydrogenase/fumarate reductase-like Fe-S protein